MIANAFDNLIFNIENYSENYSLEIDMGKVSENVDEVIHEVCKITNAQLHEWHRFTDYAIGKIIIKEETVRVYWEDYPNTLCFEFTDYQTATDFRNAIKFKGSK